MQGNHLGRSGRAGVLIILCIERTRRRHQHLQLLLRANTGRQQHLQIWRWKEKFFSDDDVENYRYCHHHKLIAQLGHLCHLYLDFCEDLLFLHPVKEMKHNNAVNNHLCQRLVEAFNSGSESNTIGGGNVEALWHRQWTLSRSSSLCPRSSKWSSSARIRSSRWFSSAWRSKDSTLAVRQDERWA